MGRGRTNERHSVRRRATNRRGARHPAALEAPGGQRCDRGIGGELATAHAAVRGIGPRPMLRRATQPEPRSVARPAGWTCERRPRPHPSPVLAPPPPQYAFGCFASPSRSRSLPSPAYHHRTALGTSPLRASASCGPSAAAARRQYMAGGGGGGTVDRCRIHSSTESLASSTEGRLAQRRLRFSYPANVGGTSKRSMSGAIFITSA